MHLRATRPQGRARQVLRGAAQQSTLDLQKSSCLASVHTRARAHRARSLKYGQARRRLPQTLATTMAATAADRRMSRTLLHRTLRQSREMHRTGQRAPTAITAPARCARP